MRGEAYQQHELRILRSEYRRIGPRFLAERLGRPVGSVYDRAWRLGIVRRRVRWTASDDAFLRTHYGRANRATVARCMGRTETAVQVRANRLAKKRRLLPA